VNRGEGAKAALASRDDSLAGNDALDLSPETRHWIAMQSLRISSVWAGGTSRPWSQ
jgi:hypothetical protein